MRISDWSSDVCSSDLDGHYDGLVFHRVIKGFMIQGGGYDASYDQRKTRAPIAIESANGLKNDRGTIALARTSDPNSATSQRSDERRVGNERVRSCRYRLWPEH